MTDVFEIVQLDPKKVRFLRSSGGILTMEYDGAVHPEVLLYRAFPLSKQTEFISVRCGKGDELGVLANLADLEPESLREAEKELRLRYLVPQITHIEKIKQFPGMWVWELETTLGPIKMSMRNLHEHMHAIGTSRLMISDMDGNRCEIANIEQLNAHSQKQLNRIL